MIEITLRKCSEIQPEGCHKKKTQRVKEGTHETKQDSDSSDRECDVIKTNVFNFHSIRLVPITKLKAKAGQKSNMRIQNRYW